MREPLDRSGILEFQRSLDRLITHTMHQVQHDVGVFRRGERVFVEAAASGRGQLRQDLRVLKKHTVIARRGLLLGVRKARGVALARRPRLQRHLADRGHDQHIPQAAAARPGQVRVAEPTDRAIRVMIAGTAIPAFDGCIRAELHHPKGHDRPGVGMPMCIRADHWQRCIHWIRRGPGGRNHQCRTHHHSKELENFHK